MKIRFYNGRILAMDGDMEVRRGEVWVQGNRIVYVGEDGVQEGSKAGSQAVLRGEMSWDREIDLDGNLIMPGFANAHTHSAMTFLRSYADDLPLQEWLEKQVFPMEAKLTEEDIYELSKLAILEYLTSGITSNFDMYFHPEMIARASIDCGFRTVMVSSLNNFNSSPEEMEQEYLRFRDYHELIGYQLGFHGEYTTSEELLKKVAALSEKYQAPVFAHNSETRREVEECIGRHGKTPTAYLDSLGMFQYGGGGYHCIHMTDEDIRIFRDRGLTAVTNPGSNTKLSSGIARISDMLDAGVRIAIGTDGPASNNCLDMFREMFLVTGLAKLKEENAAAVPAGEVLKMAVSGGARGMGLTDCGCLAEGKLADVIVIDLKQPNMQPINNVVKNLVYSGSKANVKLTMVNGRVLYEDGKFFVGTEPEEIYEKASRIMKRMME
ncbi:MAG: amidohydrolase [Lachnospiraceae bacterium]|nr:amidohydrolase [Lachnospiraceae bacterium]